VRERMRTVLALTAVTGLLALLGSALVWLAAPAQAAEAGLLAQVDPDIWRWGFLSAAFTTAVSAVSAGYAVARVGSAAVGALAEKPELLGRVLILVGLAEGIAIYGLIISVLILNRLPA
jgi:V/A-type H+-transporting ATPase subunit K